MYTNGLWVFETPAHLPNIFRFSIAYRCQPLTRSNACMAWRPMNVYLIHAIIHKIAHDWGEFGVFESELSDTKCTYTTFFCFFLGGFFQLQNSTVSNLLLFRIKMEAKLMVKLFSLSVVNSFLWPWKYRGQQVLKIQHVCKLFTKPSVNTYHCVHSVDNV